MTAPSFRSVSRKGEVIPPPADLAEQYCRTIALANGLTDTTTMATTIREIDAMRTELENLRVENKRLEMALAAAVSERDNHTWERSGW